MSAGELGKIEVSSFKGFASSEACSELVAEEERKSNCKDHNTSVAASADLTRCDVLLCRDKRTPRLEFSAFDALLYMRHAKQE